MPSLNSARTGALAGAVAGNSKSAACCNWRRIWFCQWRGFEASKSGCNRFEFSPLILVERDISKKEPACQCSFLK